MATGRRECRWTTVLEGGQDLFNLCCFWESCWGADGTSAAGPLILNQTELDLSSDPEQIKRTTNYSVHKSGIVTANNVNIVNAVPVFLITNTVELDHL